MDQQFPSAIAKVFVVIPNKDGLEHLSYSIPSLQKSSCSNFQAILVDDRSTDGSLDFVRDSHSWVRVIENKRCVGFAGAVNTGIEYSLGQGADFIAIFNSDIKVRPDWIEYALKAFEQDPNIGIVGYTEVLRNAQSYFEDFQNIKLELHDVENPSGCLFVCRACVFQKVGLLDEGYYMYGEDNDFFFRVRKAGFSIVQINTPVWHYGQGSSAQKEFLVSWLAYRNAMRFAIKNLSVMGILRTLISLVNQGCNVFLPNRNSDNNRQRLRRYNVCVNFLLVLGSCCWNIIHITRTLKSRHNRGFHLSECSVKEIWHQ